MTVVDPFRAISCLRAGMAENSLVDFLCPACWSFVEDGPGACICSTPPSPPSSLAWLWSDNLASPPDPPDPPDIPEVSLDEAHAAFAATLPALTVSDTACAQVDDAADAFADSVSDAINIASEAASAVNAISKAKAFALNAASNAAFAKEFDYNTTSAATEAAGACLYSRCVVPPRCTYLLYSTSLRMPICRILNPIPYVSTAPPPPLHAPEKGMRDGDFIRKGCAGGREGWWGGSECRF